MPRRSRQRCAGQESRQQGSEGHAMTFPGSTHDLDQIWLAAGGIDPDEDVSTIVVPPPQMVANVKISEWTRSASVSRESSSSSIRTSALRPARPARSGRENAEGFRLRARLGGQESGSHPRIVDGCDRRPGDGATSRKQAGGMSKSSASDNGSTCRSPTSSAAPRATSTTAMDGRTAPSGTHEVLHRAARPTRSRVTTPGSSPRNPGRVTTTTDRRRKGWSTRSIMRISGARPPKRSRFRPPTSRPRRHAARNGLDKARCWIRAETTTYLESLTIERVEDFRGSGDAT